MANKTQSKIKICTINICGLSNRSKMVLNKYSYDEELDAIAVQEVDTGTENLPNLELLNMSVITDTNKGKNKGAALYVNNKHSITKLDNISEISKNLDSCWGLVVMCKKRYIIGSIYVKLNHKPAVSEIMKMLDAAEKKKTEHKASGIILMGDFNARHCSWGDNINNYYGTQLAETLDSTKYSICTPKTPTFLCTNGKSHIDLNIISNSIAESVDSCVTDDHVELFSGSPTRGHVPVITELLITREYSHQSVVEKLDLTKMQWENWTQSIERKIEEDNNVTIESNPYIVWENLNQIITEATDTYCQTKKMFKT